MEGYLRKRKARLHRWTTRYFILNGKKLIYKLKQDSPVNKSEFELTSGCIVADVTEDIKGGKKLHTIWLIWPQEDEQSKNSNNETNSSIIADDSDDDENDKSANTSSKPLLQKIQNEVISHRQHYKQQQKLIEKEIESHKAHDHSIGVGAKLAALAVGGVIVGAFTFGIGLIPSLTVVSMAAASGGAVALQIRKPIGSRLILASESLDEIIAWKNALEKEIFKLDRIKKPLLPSSSDASVISSIIGMSVGGNGWKNVGYVESMRILEQISHNNGTRCRKTQVMVRNTPIKTFVSLMENNHWPVGGDIKVVKVIDDHADIIEATVLTKYKTKSTTRTFLLSRFWRLDDDGIYMITLNTAKDNVIDKNESEDTIKLDSNKKIYLGLNLDVVITVSPRRDHMEYDSDIPLALITCTCQLTSDSKFWFCNGEIETFMNDFFSQQLLDLKHSLEIHKYQLYSHHQSKKSLSTSNDLNQKSFDKINETPVERISLTRSNTIGASVLGAMTRSQNKNEELKSKVNNKLTIQSESSTVKKSIFRRSNSNQISPSHSNIPTNKSEVYVFPTDSIEPIIKKKQSYTRFGGRKKSIVNPEASSLRGQIAAKEYEVQRTEKQLKKKGAILTSESNSTTNSPNKDISVNLSEYQKLLNDLNILKAQYFQITGLPYELSMKKKSTLSRFRSIRNITSTSSTVSSTPTKAKDTSDISNLSIDVDFISHDAKKSYNKIPNHWMQQTSTNRLQYFNSSTDKYEEIQSIFLILSVFIVSLTISIYFYGLLQQL